MDISLLSGKGSHPIFDDLIPRQTRIQIEENRYHQASSVRIEKHIDKPPPVTL